jgi:hypothetical protein
LTASLRRRAPPEEHPGADAEGLDEDGLTVGHLGSHEAELAAHRKQIQREAREVVVGKACLVQAQRARFLLNRAGLDAKITEKDLTPTLTAKVRVPRLHHCRL